MTFIFYISIIDTIFESNQIYNTNQSDIFSERTTSVPCTERFFNSRTNQTENDPAINSKFPSIQYRIKRCLPTDLAKLKSKRLENRSKIQQQVEDWKNRRSARPSKARAFQKSASESRRENNAPSMIDNNKPFQNTKEVINATNFTSNNSLGQESESNSSSTSNESYQTEKYGNKTILDNQSNISQVNEKIFKDEYPISNTNLEESTTKQTGLTISSQTTSFESFDIDPTETKTGEYEMSNIPYTTSGFSNLLTDSSTLTTDIGNPGEINQNNSETTSTEQPIEEATLVPNFEEMHNSIESNSPKPDLNFPNTSHNISQILNSDQLKLSNNISDSRGEWLPQNSKLESSNASCEFNFSENTHNLEQDTTTDIDIVFSTPFSQIPLKIDLPKISGDKYNSSDLLLPSTNENRNDTTEENDSLYEENKFTVPSSLFQSKNQKQSSITTGVEWPFTDSRKSSSNSFRYDTLIDENLLKIESLPTSTSLFLTTNITVQEMSTTEDSFSMDGATSPSVSSTSLSEEYTPTNFYIPSKNTDLSNNLEDTTPTLSILTGDNENFRQIQTPLNLPIFDNQPTSFRSSISSSVTPINEEYDPNQKYDSNEKTISYLKPEDLQEYSNAATEKLSFSNLAGFRNDQSHSPVHLSTIESQQHTLSTSMATEINQSEKYESTEKNQLTDHDISFHGSNRENIFPSLITNNHPYIYSKKHSTVENLPDLSISESRIPRNRQQDSAQLRQMDSRRDENKIAPVASLPMMNSHLAPSGGISMIENMTISEINLSQEHGSSYFENLNRDEVSKANSIASSTFSTNSVTQLQNIFTADPRGSDERENPLDLQTNHLALLKLESTPVFVPHNDDSSGYHLKEDYKHSRNHKNEYFSSETETLPYPSFLRRHTHQPPESKDGGLVTVEENLTSVTKPRGNREVIFHLSAPAKFEHSDSSMKTDFLNMESASAGLEDKANYQNRGPVNQTAFKANKELYDISEKNKAQSEYEKSSVLKMEKNGQKVLSLLESQQNSSSPSTSNQVGNKTDSTTGSQDAEFEKLIRPTFKPNFGPSFVSSKVESISIPALFRPEPVLQNNNTIQISDSLQPNSTPDQFNSSQTSESFGISKNLTPNNIVANESVTRSLELTDFTQNLFERDTTETSESNIPKAYKPFNEMEFESFSTSDPKFKYNLLMTFALPANSVQGSTNQNYLTPTTTPMAESLKATEDNVTLFESRNNGKSSFTLQQNADTLTEKLKKSQISGENFDIINKSNERYNSTEPQIAEYGSTLLKLLQKENMRDNKSPQEDMKQNLFVTVTKNISDQTGESEDKFTETSIEQTENSENIEKMSNQMESFEPNAIQKIADQTRNYEQTQIFSSYSPQHTNSASFTNYGDNQPEIQISDSLSSPTNLFLTPEVTSPQYEMEIFTQVYEGLSKAENLVSNSTDRNDFQKEMETFSEDHSQMLVKKSFKHFPKLLNENSQFSTPVVVTNPPNRYIPKKYKLRHFLNSSRVNMFKRSHLGSINSISEDQKSSYIPTIAPTDSPREFDHPSIAESLSTDSTTEFASENWNSSEDLENKTKTRESLQDNNFPTITLFQNNSNSYPQNLVNLNVMKKTHKIQPGEVVPPMNPNENWKIGENDTYYTIEELKSFFKMKKKSLISEKGMNKYLPEIVIDLNGLNETTIIDFLKHNLTNAHQNETTSLNTTKYKIFKLFSNSTDNFDRNELKNESSNSTLIYSLIPQEDLYQRMNSSENTSATSDQKLKTSKYLAQLFNATKEDENALKFFQELLSLNEIFSRPNLDFEKNEFNETTSNRNASNSTDILEDNCTGKTEVILVNLNDPQPEKELLEKLCSDCNKIVVIADNNGTQLKNAQHVNEKKTLVENIISSMEKLSISDKKDLVKGKDDFEGDTNITGRKNGVEGKSASSPENGVNNVNEILSSRHHNFLPGSRHHFKIRDPEEQLIKKQFSFVNPQVVDNFLDVYKHYSPRHSPSRSRMRQERRNNARSTSDDVDWIPRPHNSHRNEPPDNFMDNLLRELVRLRNSVPAAYVSHGYAN